MPFSFRKRNKRPARRGGPYIMGPYTFVFIFIKMNGHFFWKKKQNPAGRGVLPRSGGFATAIHLFSLLIIRFRKSTGFGVWAPPSRCNSRFHRAPFLQLKGRFACREYPRRAGAGWGSAPDPAGAPPQTPAGGFAPLHPPCSRSSRASR